MLHNICDPTRASGIAAQCDLRDGGDEFYDNEAS
jgi:hypothetical protein